MPIDNNLIERQIKAWKLGAKNWRFIGSELAGQRAAVVMSLVQSAKLNGLDPWAQLRDVLARIHSHPSHRIDQCRAGSRHQQDSVAIGGRTPRGLASWCCAPTPSRWWRRTLTLEVVRQHHGKPVTARTANEVSRQALNARGRNRRVATG